MHAKSNKIHMKNWVNQACILVVGVNHGNACGSSNLGCVSIGPEKGHWCHHQESMAYISSMHEFIAIVERLFDPSTLQYGLLQNIKLKVWLVWDPFKYIIYLEKMVSRWYQTGLFFEAIGGTLMEVPCGAPSITHSW